MKNLEINAIIILATAVAKLKKYIYLVFPVDAVSPLCYNRDTSLMDINYPGLRGRGQTERGKDYV